MLRSLNLKRIIINTRQRNGRRDAAALLGQVRVVDDVVTEHWNWLRARRHWDCAVE